MPATYEPIATTTASGSTATITFNSISGSYTDLVLVVSAKLASGVQDLRIRFNSDSGTNYSYTYLSGDGSSTYSARATTQTYITGDVYGYLNSTNNNISIHNIMNYSNTTTNKTMISRSNNSATGVDAIVGLWRSTAAITSIEISNTGSTNFANTSTFTLYGVKAA
jgi:hypothetical protein